MRGDELVLLSANFLTRRRVVAVRVLGDWPGYPVVAGTAQCRPHIQPPPEAPPCTEPIWRFARPACSDRSLTSGVTKTLPTGFRAVRTQIPPQTGDRSKEMAMSVAKSDQLAYRKTKGSRGRRPPRFDAETYRDRNVVERVQPAQATARCHSHPIRQARAQLPRKSRHREHRPVLAQRFVRHALEASAPPVPSSGKASPRPSSTRMVLRQ
jgi:hypothetical protein